MYCMDPLGSLIDRRARWRTDMHRSENHEDALLLRAEECARITSLGRSTIFNLIAAGQLPVVRVGRAVRVPRAGLEEWISQRTKCSVGVSAFEGELAGAER